MFTRNGRATALISYIFMCVCAAKVFPRELVMQSSLHDTLSLLSKRIQLQIRFRP